MGRRAKFSNDQFIDVAIDLIAEHGPKAATVDAIARELGAPIGSVYHRFPSRNILLAELWLGIVESFQRGFVELLKCDDGLGTALYTPHWVRNYPKEGRILLCYRRDDIASGEWPDGVKERAERLTRRLDYEIRVFTGRLFGRITEQAVQKVTFALIDVPFAAVRRYIEGGKTPPEFIDNLIKETYLAILGRN